MSLDSNSSRANEPGLTHGLALTGCRQRSIPHVSGRGAHQVQTLRGQRSGTLMP
jgi:hypothetical protein